MPTPSLIIPSAPVYDEGLLYGLNVYGTNFVPEPIPFTRATTATRTNAAGLIELAPYNLLTYSEQFDNADWAKSEISILPNVIVAPIGDLTADKIVPSNVLGQHFLRRFPPLTLITGQSIVTYSIYVKISEYNSLRVGTNASASIGATFNLSTGVITNNTAISASIQNAGNGWYRCVVTGVVGSVLDIVLVDNSGNTSFSGNGTDGIFIWGAQLVEGTDPLPYLKTITRLNRPRVDFSLGGCPNLLLEPQRTNLALQSSSFDSASWTKNNTTATANTTTSPSGVVDADTLTADGTSNFHQIQQGSISVVSGTNYTTSVYAKKNTNNFIQILLGSGTFGVNVWANFDLNNGVVGSVGSATAARIENVGNGWYRCTITGVATSTSVNGASGFLIVSSATSPRAESNSLTTSVFLWGAQLEVGAYSTSFIPTTTTSVTRNADSFTESNIFSRGMITAAGGTWFVELRNNRVLTRDVGGSIVIFLGDSSNATTGNCFRIWSGTSTRFLIQKTISGTGTQLFTTSTDTVKLAIKWNGSTADVFDNGVKVVSATTFTATALQNLIGGAEQTPAYINEMALYSTPLSDTECINLTTL